MTRRVSKLSTSPKRRKAVRFKYESVRSVADLLRFLKAHTRNGQRIWFRGQSNMKWPLVPSLARTPSHLVREGALIKRFMQNATPLLSSPPRDEWEWMFLMQHHRAYTRLLDWTESPLAALHFAVNSERNTKLPGAVWCLDPVALNNAANLKFDFEAEIPAFGLDKTLDNYLPSRVQHNPSELFPIAIVGPRNTPRMAAQLGTFTINHKIHTPIEELGDRSHAWRWIIPASSKRRISQELKLLEISALTLFPELDRVADLSKELLA